MCTGGLFPVVDLSNWLVQLVVTALFIAIAVLHLVKKTAFKYFSMADANFEPHPSSQSDSSSDSVKQMCPGPGTAAINNRRDNSCVVCGSSTKKQCSGCKFVRYCSAACQSSHWKSGHKTECKDFQLSGKVKSKQSAFIQHGQKGSNAVALVPARVPCSTIKPLKEVLFPYEDFVELYKWNKPGFPPCGLINCGNSCFANVVLQCLSHTRPLVAYLVEKGHRSECRRNDWCFLCEFEIHIGRASTSRQPFSPLNILSRLPNIGGNLGYGKQEDAHEFMRFAIDTMQSVCLDEFGGEKFLHPSTQETTLIQHIFGGHLQSQVICSKCRNISNQYENMMDLTVEIQGDAASLEECLNQFTAKEQLHGDNKYKCDGCNDYVMAWKRLMIRRAPNILTIALKRFQSGRFGKLNKRVTFPETLDLSPYVIEESDGNDVYKLYAVVVHVDMLNASFFGHYICYTKDFQGNWYRIDDWKVSKVDLEEVLSEGAYMLLYSRVCPRPSCLKPIGSPLSKEQQTVKAVQEEEKQLAEHLLDRVESTDSICISAPGSSCDTNFQSKVSCTIQTDSFSSRSVPHDMRDDADMATDSDTSPFSSPEDMDVLSSQVSKSGEEIALASSACMDNGIASQAGLEQGAEADAKVLPSFSTTESSQCLEEGGDTIASCRNHNDSQDMVNSVDSKRVPSEKMESGNSKLADDGTKLKPLFTPGFLGKRPHGNSSSLRRRGRSTSSDLGGELAASGCYQRETGLANGSRTKKDVQSKQPPPPECNGLSSLTMVNGLSLDGGEGSGDDHDNREKPPARRYKF